MEDQPQFDIPTQPELEAAAAEQPRFKTLGVRLEEGLHAQLSFITQLNGSTLADEIRGAIEDHVLAAQSDPELIARAEAARAEIERQAAARRQAIAGFFGQVGVEHGADPEGSPTSGAGTEPGSSDQLAANRSRRKIPATGPRSSPE